MSVSNWAESPQEWFSTHPEMLFAEFLSWEKATHDTIDFKKSYVDMADGDLHAGLVLSEIVYWYLPSKRGEENKLRVTRNDRQWIACKRAEWWDRVRLKPKQIDAALKQLIKLGLVVKDTFKFGKENTLHVSLEVPAFVKAWQHYTKNPTPLNPRSQIGNLEVPKSGILKFPKTELPYTETTTKTTKESKRGAKAPARNLHFDELVKLFGVDYERMTKSEKTAYGKVANELKAAGVQPDEMCSLHAYVSKLAQDQKWNGFTIHALAAHNSNWRRSQSGGNKPNPMQGLKPL